MTYLDKEFEVSRIIAKRLINGCSAEEEQLLKKWLEEDEANQIVYDNLLLGESQLVRNQFLKDLNMRASWLKVESQLKIKRKTIRFKIASISAAAAVFIGLVIGTFMWFYGTHLNNYIADTSIKPGRSKALLHMHDGQTIQLGDEAINIIAEIDGIVINNKSDRVVYVDKAEPRSEDHVHYNTIVVPRGGEYQLILSDGTAVWINADSELRFPVTFDKNERRVELIGEAYFEVQHNENKPFIVDAMGTEVKVLGTSFNVSSYYDQEQVAATLIEGSVKVTSLSNDKMLEPGQQALIRRSDSAISVVEVDANLYTTWKDGIFSFEEMTLENISVQLERWYDVEIEFKDDAIAQILFTGVVKRDNSLDFALDLFHRLYPIEYDIVGRNVTIDLKN